MKKTITFLSTNKDSLNTLPSSEYGSGGSGSSCGNLSNSGNGAGYLSAGTGFYNSTGCSDKRWMSLYFSGDMNGFGCSSNYKTR